MSFEFMNYTNIKWIAHRGLSSEFQENTYEAFLHAAKLPFFGIETDCHVTKDNQIVLYHDATIKMKDASLMIKEATLSEIRNIKLDYNARIPVLEEYLALCKNYQKHAFIELKDVFDDFKIKLIYEKTQQYLELNQITFISFHLDNLKKMRLLNPHLKIQYILGHHEQEKIDLAVQYGFDMNIHHHSLFNDLIDFIHDHHLKVNCWTVNSKNDAEKYIEMGIDFITTDGF